MKSFQPKSQDISRRRAPRRPRLNPQLVPLRELTAKLKENLTRCAEPGQHGGKEHEPSVDAVHDVRTGTRRIEAILDSIQRSDSIRRSTLQNSPGLSPESPSANGALNEAVDRWRRLLKKIRRSAGAIRDLDVHRGLLADLLKDLAKQPETKPGRLANGPAQSPEGTTDRAPRFAALQKQAEDLDAWLKHTRHDHSQPLVQGAKKWAGKLDAHLEALAEALQSQRTQRRKANPAVNALDAFAHLATEMQQLYADNLHDFRKGAKKARYLAETGGEDEYAGAIGKALKKLQDEIGDWHDWLVLAEEAHRALGGQGAELIARIEHEREDHYDSAMKTAERMRGRLMGEWRASASRPRRITRPALL